MINERPGFMKTSKFRDEQKNDILAFGFNEEGGRGVRRCSYLF